MKRILGSFLVTSLFLGVITAFPLVLHANGTTQTQNGIDRSDFNTHQYKSDITYVIDKRVMWKYPDGTFRPSGQMTQGQLLTSLVAVMQLKDKSSLAQLPAGHWAKDIYEKANKVGILNGVPIDPNRLLTKEEAALIINNAWLPYRGGIWPGVTNYQHLIARGILPKVWGQTTESPFLRSEAAHIIKFLHIEYNGIVAGRKIADQFHNSLKVDNGYLTVAIPNPKNMRVEVFILREGGRDRDLYFKGGMPLRVKVSEVKHMLFQVYVPDKPESVASYSYREIPKLSRVNTMIKSE